MFVGKDIVMSKINLVLIKNIQEDIEKVTELENNNQYIVVSGLMTNREFSEKHEKLTNSIIYQCNILRRTLSFKFRVFEHKDLLTSTELNKLSADLKLLQSISSTKMDKFSQSKSKNNNTWVIISIIVMILIALIGWYFNGYF